MIDRREFIGLLSAAAAAGMLPACSSRLLNPQSYAMTQFGNVRLLHFTDCHAQLLPIYFREPNVNLGFHQAYNKPPHLVGEALLERTGIAAGSSEAHAFTHLNFVDAAHQFGKVGGFAHLRTLVNQLRSEVPEGSSLLMDGGDTWQGSATSLWTRGRNMVDACNLLGVDVMTGHWEFTYQAEEVLENIRRFKGDFVAHNVMLTDDALFDGSPAFDEDTGQVFQPYVLRDVGGYQVAIIGQAFPYTPIANPSRFIPDWTFGIRAVELQKLVDRIRDRHSVGAVILLSHNGMDVDIKLGGTVSGLDIIFGGHTHDNFPQPVVIENFTGKTIVTNAGSNGKFLGVMDLDIRGGGIRDFRYRMLPVFSNLLEPDAEMQAYIDESRRPYEEALNEELAVADSLLYRRGNFNGTFDQLICDAMREVGDAEIALSPGFRWGTSILPGQPITMERLMDQTAITYPETYVREMQGSELKLILESVADNLFHPDPFYQQGGDMVRVGGLDYSCDPNRDMGGRIDNLRLPDGRLLEADKSYKVAGWATVGAQSAGPPIWDVVAEYLRDRKVIRIDRLETPRLVNVRGNPGLADYEGEVS